MILKRILNDNLQCKYLIILFHCNLFCQRVNLFYAFSYIVPEYSFLDARGLGAYEGKNLESVSDVGFLHILFLRISSDMT